jgi:4'-phosphopantetheinyl transferase
LEGAVGQAEALGQTVPVDLWFLSLDQRDSDTDEFAQTLSLSEQARAQRFVQRRDRSRFIVGRYAMRCVLSKALNRSPKQVSLGVGPQDKPVSKDNPRLAFNLSHSQGVAVLALVDESAVDQSIEYGSGAPTSFELGVDIEKAQALSDPQALFKHCLCERELAGLLALDEREQAAVFFEIWVRKEACLKALGVGFEIEPHRFDSGWCFERSHQPTSCSDMVKVCGRPALKVVQLSSLDTFVQALPLPGGFQGWYGAVAMVARTPLPRIRRFEFDGA